MSRWRELSALLITIALIGFVISESWSSREERDSEPLGESSLRTGSVEEFVFTMQSRFAVGAERIGSGVSAGEMPVDAAERLMASTLDKALRDAFKTAFASPATDGDLNSLTKRNLRRRQAILMGYLRLDAADQLVRELEPCAGCLEEENLLNQAVQACVNIQRGSAAPATMDDESRDILNESLGWHGRLCNMAAASPAERASLEAEIFAPAESSFRRIATGMAIVGALLLCGVVFLLVYLYWFLSRRAVFQFSPDKTLAPWNLEVFALYLFLFAVLGKTAQYSMDWLETQGIELNRFFVSGVIILALPVTLLWPLVSAKVSWTRIRASVGLQIESGRRFIQDVCIAPTFYLSFWIILSVLLVLYTILLQWLNVDTTQGTHPVVPILLGSADRKTQLAIILLAVVIAPLVEEVMFRGALYSWLRSRMSAVFAIPVSAVIFAAVHPQGPVWLVPLGMIGMMLAFLREWRGSLVAPILAHACVNGGTMLILMTLMEQ